MRRSLRKTLPVLVFLLLFLAIAGGKSSAAEPEEMPFWLAMQKVEGLGSQRSHWRAEFEIEAEVKTASLRLTGDFASVGATLNSERFVPVAAFDPVVEIDVTRLLRVGKNSISLTGYSAAGPSAVASRLDVELENGKRIVVISDSSWQCTLGDFVDSDTVTRGRIDPRRWALNRLPDIDAFAEYNQWKEALPEDGESSAALDEKLSPLPPGFHIERLHTAVPGEGSWVSMAVDQKGRMIIAREAKGLLRLSMPEEGDGEIGVEVINDTLEECRGLVFRDGVLFANANRSKALYRLRDTTGDDQYDEVTLLQATEGGTGHGRNDLALGPDGKIHAIHGDSVLVPENADLRTVAEPEAEAPKHLGHWLRTDGEPAGGGEGKANWEILARGLRNPYGVDFNEDGEAFTYDADNEGDVGLPFYRPTRINHLVSGANYGWHQQRGNTRNMPVYAPDSVPTTFDVGRGSPTAVKFGTRSNFPEYWRRALFALDWAYGRIVAVHLTPRGASYYGAGEVFLEGRPLNVTDLDFLADGSMVFVTGGRKTQSALYRVSYVGERASEPLEVGEQAKLRAGFSKEARQLRRDLEKFHGRVDERAVNAVWVHLGSEDPWIRNAARVALESQPVEKWRKKVLGYEVPAADKRPWIDGGQKSQKSNRVLPMRYLELGYQTGLLSFARMGTNVDRKNLLERVLDESQPEVVGGLQGLRILELCAKQMTDGEMAKAESLIGGHLPAISSSGIVGESMSREECRLLGIVQSPAAVRLGMQRMASADDQMLRLHYLEMLSEAPAGWDAESREQYFGALIDAEKSSLGDRFMAGFFDTVKRHALANIADDQERRRYADLLEASAKVDGTVAGAALPEPEPREIVQHWLMKDFPVADLETELSTANRNLDQGKAMFSAALCNRCHVSGSEGRSMGPDLTTVGRRFSSRDLLESIIEPSKVVAEVHRTMLITLKDGSTVSGRIIGDDFRQSLLTVGVNPFDPSDQRQIPKGDIAKSVEMSISPMPTGLLDTLTRNEVLDLLAWLIDENGEIGTPR